MDRRADDPLWSIPCGPSPPAPLQRPLSVFQLLHRMHRVIRAWREATAASPTSQAQIGVNECNTQR